ncbi:GNAT family N-acetyltransferase [Caenimonas sp. SL110]|uniref:GNAT family N-acetyltransferase n=1 Tax=Caenimonas sp. SL110 TaxID=1450524 RepID=UPI00128D1C76|nr:GNAT family N-acetyltransferase [Caenimonas sp. SL110]
MPEYEIRPASHIDAGILHGAFREAFADYLIGPFTLGLDQWPQFLERHTIELTQSRVAMRRGDVIAFALVAPRPRIAAWRLATMGAIRSARGSGAAPALLDDFIERARAAQVEWVELECFAQNERALRLYTSRGFEAISPLYGYVREGRAPVDAAVSTADVDMIDLGDAFGFIDAVDFRLCNLPLQVTPASLRAVEGTLHAMRCGDAVIVYVETGPEALTIQSLVDADPAQADAKALIAALIEDHPRHRIVVPQLQRPDVGGEALEKMGFVRQPLHQVLMRKALTPSPP